MNSQAQLDPGISELFQTLNKITVAPYSFQKVTNFTHDLKSHFNPV